MDAISKNNAIPQTTRNRMAESGSFLKICPFFAFFPTTRKTIFILLWFYFEWRSWIVRFLELKTTTTKISGLLFILISGPMFQIKKTRTAIIHDNLITCIIQGPALLKNVSVGSPSRLIQQKKPYKQLQALQSISIKPNVKIVELTEGILLPYRQKNRTNPFTSRLNPTTRVSQRFAPRWIFL